MYILAHTIREMSDLKRNITLHANAAALGISRYIARAFHKLSTDVARAMPIDNLIINRVLSKSM